MNKNMVRFIMIAVLSQGDIAWGMMGDLAIGYPTKFPLDTFVAVLSYCNERDWARLRMACEWFNQNLSITTPSLAIIQHQAFRPDQGNVVQSLAFNAAWNGNFDILRTMIKYMKQIDYKSVLDKLISFSRGKPKQQKYIEMYQKCGGKTNKELESCIIS